VLPAGHTLTSREIVTADDLIDEALVVFPHTVDPDGHAWMLDQIGNAGYRFRAVKEAEGSTPRDLVLAVAGGLGIGFAPRWIEQINPAETLVVRRALAPAVSTPEAVLTWHKHPSKQLQAVLAGIRELAREMHREADEEDSDSDAGAQKESRSGTTANAGTEETPAGSAGRSRPDRCPPGGSGGDGA
jgi:DNA-binding transcriptional LysR family regulator